MWPTSCLSKTPIDQHQKALVDLGLDSIERRLAAKTFSLQEKNTGAHPAGDAVVQVNPLCFLPLSAQSLRRKSNRG